MSTHEDRQQALNTLNGDDTMPGEYCAECNNLGFVIIDDDNRSLVERCDTCGRCETDEEATKALDDFIAAHAPKPPANDDPNAFSILPKGCMTPEGNARLAKAMEEFADAKAEMANYFASLCRDCAGGSGNLQNQARALARRLNDRSNYVEVDMEALTELLERHHDAQQELLAAVAGMPSKAELAEQHRRASEAARNRQAADDSRTHGLKGSLEFVILLCRSADKYMGTPRHERYMKALHRAKRHSRSVTEIRLAVTTYALGRL
jgi:hypothetical protein